MHAVLDSRYSFSAQFLNAAARMTRLAIKIEARPVESVDGELRSEHLAFTSGAIMQAVAALEADSWEVINYGPGHHLGSSAENTTAVTALEPLAEMLEAQDVFKRYATALHILGKPSPDRGAQPWQDAQLLVRLRNEITHYKSRSGTEMDRAKLFSALKAKAVSIPPFWPEEGVNFFPLHCLSAHRSAWAVNTSVALVTKIYEHFGIRSPLVGYPEGWFSVDA